MCNFMTPVSGVKKGFHLSATPSIKQEWYLLPRQVDVQVEGITRYCIFFFESKVVKKKTNLIYPSAYLSTYLPSVHPSVHPFIHFS